ncbi:hypothetical protein AB6F08_12300 [Staphylococcus saprophyticus]|uniref:hypothetical protein n=1 Tax=Staphylococcus saprophyticus TaxID=29385 RepID=UPI0034DCFCCA
MSEPTKEELLDFMRKHGPEKVDSITDTESAIRHFRCTSKVYKEQRDQFKTERDTLIDDIAVLKANISRLERENEKLVWTLKNKEDVIDWNCLKIRGLKEDIEKYKRGISNLINENELKHNLLSEISQHIGNKPSSSTYKYFRAKLDNLNITEDKQK